MITSYTDFPVCPHCGHVDGDPSELDFSSDEVIQTWCGSCGNPYVVMQHILTTYTTEEP